LKDVIALVEAGAEVNAGGDLGYTALPIVASHGHQDIVRVRLRGGADIHAQTEFRDQPIDLGEVDGTGSQGDSRVGHKSQERNAL
jgi:ankyrin repeat protein